MPLDSLCVPTGANLSPRILIFGIGGGGGNAIRTMLKKGLEGVEFVAANTDAQALAHIEGEIDRIQLGENITQGLGAGANPEVGRAAAEESRSAIQEKLKDVHLCFLTAGMGGGTGTGASPIIAEIAREMGVVTVGVVTKPFFFEGDRRMDIANEGLNQLEKFVNTLLVIPNQNLFSISKEDTSTTSAFDKADEVLYQGVKSITDLMVKPGLINLDFADVKSVLEYPGRAIMGVGVAEGAERGKHAALQAMNSQLIEDTDITNAKAVLINIVGGEDQKLFDLSEASEEIRIAIPKETHVIVGMSQDPEYNGFCSVSLVATGLTGSGETGEGHSSMEDSFGFEDEHMFINNSLPTDFFNEEETDTGEKIAEPVNTDIPEGTLPDYGNNTVQEENNARVFPAQSFAAPKLDDPDEKTDEEVVNQTQSKTVYKEVIESYNSNSTVDDNTEIEAIDEEDKPTTKTGFNLLKFIDRRKKSTKKKNKIPAFERRQAN